MTQILEIEDPTGIHFLRLCAQGRLAQRIRSTLGWTTSELMLGSASQFEATTGRAGVPRGKFWDRYDVGARVRVARAARFLERSGWTIVPVDNLVGSESKAAAAALQAQASDLRACFDLLRMRITGSCSETDLLVLPISKDLDGDSEVHAYTFVAVAQCLGWGLHSAPTARGTQGGSPGIAIALQELTPDKRSLVSSLVVEL